MHILTNIHDIEIPELWREFMKIVNWESWKKRVDELKRQCHNNPLQTWLFEKRHALEFGIDKVQRHYLPKRRYPSIVKNPQYYESMAFACSVSKIYRELSPAARGRFCGMLNAGLNDEYGLASIAFEIELSNHLFRQGFDVSFSDLEGIGRHDYLARHIKNGVELEIECKIITGDKGRKIHSTDLVKLLRLLEKIVAPLLQTPGGKIVQIELPSRLEPDHAAMQRIVDLVRLTIAGATITDQSDVCSVMLTPFEIASSPFVDLRKIDSAALPDFTAKHFAARLSTLTSFSSTADNSCVIIEVHSKEPDSLVKRIYRVAKEAADKQFSKCKPALIAIKLGEVTSEEIREFHWLQQNQQLDPMQAIANRLLRNTKRNHVHSIGFLGQSDIISSLGGTTNNTALPSMAQGQGSIYVFNNHNHQDYADLRYRLFEQRLA